MYHHSARPFLRQAASSGIALLVLFIATLQPAAAAGATPDSLEAGPTGC